MCLFNFFGITTNKDAYALGRVHFAQTFKDWAKDDDTRLSLVFYLAQRQLAQIKLYYVDATRFFHFTFFTFVRFCVVY